MKHSCTAIAQTGLDQPVEDRLVLEIARLAIGDVGLIERLDAALAVEARTGRLYLQNGVDLVLAYADALANLPVIQGL